MNDDAFKVSLSQIETRWSLVLKAHRWTGDASATAAAQRDFMERYAGAVHRYLLAVTKDAHVAADLAQEFALRFLRGDFHRADPMRGRFRNYVKSAVLNLVIDVQRQAKHRPKPLPADGQTLPSPTDDLADLDRQFLDCWRDEILERAWKGLEARESKSSGPPFFTLLRYRADHPGLRSQEIADRLAVVLDRPLTAGWVRQNLRRAREVFVELVQAEVAHSLGHPSDEERDEEMRNLGLWTYCRLDGE